MAADRSPSALPLWEDVLPELARPAGGAAPAACLLGMEQPSLMHDFAESAEQQAAEVLAEAQGQAAQIIAQAEEAATEIAADARASAVRALTQQQGTAFEAVVSAVREDLSAELGAWCAQLEADAVRLCVDLAEQVLRREVAQSPDAIMAMVREAVVRMSGGKRIVVHVSPAGEERMRAAAAELASPLPSGVEVEVVADSAVDEAGALITSEAGTIDVQIRTQVARLREAAEAVLAQETERR